MDQSTDSSSCSSALSSPETIFMKFGFHPQDPIIQLSRSRPRRFLPQRVAFSQPASSTDLPIPPILRCLPPPLNRHQHPEICSPIPFKYVVKARPSPLSSVLVQSNIVFSHYYLDAFFESPHLHLVLCMLLWVFPIAALLLDYITLVSWLNAIIILSAIALSCIMATRLDRFLLLQACHTFDFWLFTCHLLVFVVISSYQSSLQYPYDPRIIHSITGSGEFVIWRFFAYCCFAFLMIVALLQDSIRIHPLARLYLTATAVASSWTMFLTGRVFGNDRMIAGFSSSTIPNFCSPSGLCFSMQLVRLDILLLPAIMVVRSLFVLLTHHNELLLLRCKLRIFTFDRADDTRPHADADFFDFHSFYQFLIGLLSIHHAPNSVIGIGSSTSSSISSSLNSALSSFDRQSRFKLFYDSKSIQFRLQNRPPLYRLRRYRSIAFGLKCMSELEALSERSTQGDVEEDDVGIFDRTIPTRLDLFKRPAAIGTTSPLQLSSLAKYFSSRDAQFRIIAAAAASSPKLPTKFAEPAFIVSTPPEMREQRRLIRLSTFTSGATTDYAFNIESSWSPDHLNRLDYLVDQRDDSVKPFPPYLRHCPAPTPSSSDVNVVQFNFSAVSSQAVNKSLSKSLSRFLDISKSAASVCSSHVVSFPSIAPRMTPSFSAHLTESKSSSQTSTSDSSPLSILSTLDPLAAFLSTFAKFPWHQFKLSSFCSASLHESLSSMERKIRISTQHQLTDQNFDVKFESRSLFPSPFSFQLAQLFAYFLTILSYLLFLFNQPKSWSIAILLIIISIVWMTSVASWMQIPVALQLLRYPEVILLLACQVFYLFIVIYQSFDRRYMVHWMRRLELSSPDNPEIISASNYSLMVLAGLFWNIFSIFSSIVATFADAIPPKLYYWKLYHMLFMIIIGVSSPIIALYKRFQVMEFAPQVCLLSVCDNTFALWVKVVILPTLFYMKYFFNLIRYPHSMVILTSPLIVKLSTAESSSS